MKKGKITVKVYLIIVFILLVVSFIAFFITGAINNKRQRKYIGIVNQDNKSFLVSLDISKTWTNDEGTEKQTFGEQFDFAIKDHQKFDLRGWNLTINFDDEDFELVKIDSLWNVDAVIDGNKLTITPHTDITLAHLSPKEANSFGFIFILKNEITEDNFSNFNYTLTGTVYRKYVSYPVFWVLTVLLMIYVSVVVAYIIVRVKERNFEKFKEQSYSMISQSMNTFASLIDTKDPYTKDHSARVSYYSVKIARKLGLDDEFVRKIAYIALMHDCGKLVIPDEILTKPARLTDDEYAVMKEHTTYGGKALENFTSIEEIKNGAMYHHEKWDGSGYPKGLKGEDIPLCARIIGVADALDAMNSDRCYRKRLSKEKILSELAEYAGKQFDPNIAALTIEMIKSGEIDINENEA